MVLSANFSSPLSLEMDAYTVFLAHAPKRGFLMFKFLKINMRFTFRRMRHTVTQIFICIDIIQKVDGKI